MCVMYRLSTAVTVMLIGAQLAEAGSIQSFEAIDSGIYTSNGEKITPSFPGEVYTVGFAGGLFGNAGEELRSFLLFDLSSLSIPDGERVAGVTLVLDTQLYRSPHPSELIQFSEVSASIDVLLNGTEGLTTFSDLGDGALFASQVYTPMNSLQTLSIQLNSLSFMALEQAVGKMFAIGIVMPTIDFAAHDELDDLQLDFDEYIFGGGGVSGVQRLDILLAVPEPGAAFLWSIALAHILRVRLNEGRRDREFGHTHII